MKASRWPWIPSFASKKKKKKKKKKFVVDRFLYTPMRYPGNYGFIPHTLSADGDPCDVLVANTRPIVPGAIVAVRPIGVLKMMDEADGDEKIIAVPIPKLTQRYAHVHNYTVYRKLPGARSSISLHTTRTSKRESG